MGPDGCFPGGAAGPAGLPCGACGRESTRAMLTASEAQGSHHTLFLLLPEGPRAPWDAGPRPSLHCPPPTPLSVFLFLFPFEHIHITRFGAVFKHPLALTGFTHELCKSE